MTIINFVILYTIQLRLSNPVSLFRIGLPRTGYIQSAFCQFVCAIKKSIYLIDNTGTL